MKNRLEKKLTSVRPITLAMILVMIPISIEMAFLFEIFLKPVVTIDYARFIASGFVGVAIGVSMMLASINSEYIADLRIKIDDDRYLGMPEAFFFLSLTGLLILFKVPDFEGTTFGWYFGRIFGALTYATVEYIFSKMFINKYNADKEKFMPKSRKRNTIIEDSKKELLAGANKYRKNRTNELHPRTKENQKPVANSQ